MFAERRAVNAKELTDEFTNEQQIFGLIFHRLTELTPNADYVICFGTFAQNVGKNAAALLSEYEKRHQQTASSSG